MEAGNHPRKPLLIVAPTGLLKNWEDEANIHLASPGLGGLFKAFGDGLNALKDLSHNQRKDKLSTSDWVLTTYETLRDKIRYFLPVDWAVVAFDEVQKIKNPASRLTEMAKSVQADFFLALTGTPIENRLGDLWSIIDTVAPGTLGSLKDFHSRYEGESNEETAIAVADLRRTLTETPKPVRLLRRMKSEHLKGLPDKTEHIIRMPMPSAQANAYDAVIASVRAGVLEKGDILGVLQGMRKVSLLPDAIGDKGITDEVIASSARLTALVSILDEVKSRNEKALVFLEFIAVQDSLIPYLQARYGMARPPLRISGSVQGHVRKKHVDEFQSRPRDEFDVMLLSPKAGGVGLTLTAANNVIHLSRWWNPAVEEQCTDRVFRIGQDKPVNVYYPLAIHPFIQESSFDVNLHGLLERKRELSRQLLSAPDASADELESLLKSSI
jgi:SNF2 family DNA or RNA helicase